MPTISLPCRSSETSCRRGRPSPASVTGLQRQNDGPERNRLDLRLRDRAADHQLGQLVTVRLGRRRSATSLPSRSTTTRRLAAITSCSLWEMKMMARPRSTSFQGREQRLGFLRRQHGGRLIQNQDAGIAVERLQDLDPLALADRKIGDAGVRIDRQAKRLRQLRQLGARVGVRCDRERHRARYRGRCCRAPSGCRPG